MFDMVIKRPFDSEKNWPKDENGEAVKPAVLVHLSESNIEAGIMTNMLRAYNIPVFLSYPNDGEFGKIIMGFSGSGVDICVPETMIDEARNLISADIDDTDSETEEQ